MAAKHLEAQLGALQLNKAPELPQFHANWIDTTEITPQMATAIVQDIKLEYEDISSNDGETRLTLHFNGVKYLSDVAASAFLNKLKGDLVQARRDLNKAIELLAKARSQNLAQAEHLRHLDGVEFVLKLLQGYIDGKEEPPAEAVRNYALLPSRSKAAVLALKEDFIHERLPGKFWPLADAIPRELIRLDPLTADWHLRLYKQFWHAYRKPISVIEKGVELVKMKEALEAAMDLEPEHPTVLLYWCECVMELVKRVNKLDRASGQMVWHGRLEFGGETFASVEELDSSIMDKYRQVLEYCPTVHSRLKIAMNLCMRSNSSSMVAVRRSPEQLRFAKECLDEALASCPNSGKVYHKLGLYSLIVDRDVPQAVVHFRHGHELGPSHFSTLVDLVITLLANPIEHKDEVLELVERHSADTAPWSTTQKTQMKHLKGSLLFMTGQKQEAIQIWADIGRDGFGFQNLPFKYARYQWPKEKISFELIASEIRRVKRNNPASFALQELADEIDRHLRSGGLRQASGQQHAGGRGRGGRWGPALAPPQPQFLPPPFRRGSSGGSSGSDWVHVQQGRSGRPDRGDSKGATPAAADMDQNWRS